MSMHTFDNAQSQGEANFLEQLDTNGLPDEIECGENNKFWVKVWRKARVMVLIDKIDGKVLKKVEIEQPEFMRIAASFGVGPRQAGAAQDALKLK